MNSSSSAAGSPPPVRRPRLAFAAGMALAAPPRPAPSRPPGRRPPASPSATTPSRSSTPACSRGLAATTCWSGTSTTASTASRPGAGTGPASTRWRTRRVPPSRPPATRSRRAGSASTTPSTSSSDRHQRPGDRRRRARHGEDRRRPAGPGRATTHLVVYDVTGDEPERLGSLDLSGLDDAEILLVGDRVVAIGHDAERRAEATDRPRHPRAGRRRRRPGQPRGRRRHGVRRRRWSPRACTATRSGWSSRRPAGPGLRRSRGCARAPRAALGEPGDRPGLHDRGLAAARDHRRDDGATGAARSTATDVADPGRRGRPRHPRAWSGFDAATAGDGSTRSAWPGTRPDRLRVGRPPLPGRARAGQRLRLHRLHRPPATSRACRAHGHHLPVTTSTSTAPRRRTPRRARSRARSPTVGRWTRPTACFGSRSGRPHETGNFNSVVTLRAATATTWSRSAGSTSSASNEEIKSMRWFDGLADPGDLPPGRPALRRST